MCWLLSGLVDGVGAAGSSRSGLCGLVWLAFVSVALIFASSGVGSLGVWGFGFGISPCLRSLVRMVNLF